METPSALGHALASTVVPPRSVAIAWLGQASFVLKSPQGELLALDPYLSNSCKALGDEAGFNMDRQVPAPLHPAELASFSGLFFSHSHQDHVDPETIGPYLEAGGDLPLIAPHDAAQLLEKLGVRRDLITMTWPNQTHRMGDFSLRTTFAIPPDGGDLTHVGYLVEVADGPRIYFTGDTDENDILGISVGPYQPDILVTVVNPAFRNLSPAQAAKLAKTLMPKWAIPCHHDLFPDNSLPDRLFQTNLTILGVKELFCPLRQGELRIFGVPDDRKRPEKPLI